MRIVKPLDAALILMPFVACALFYWPTLGGALLSDDYAVLGALWNWAQEGRLLTALLAKFHEGLDSPSFYYRPLSMASFGINFVFAGAHPLQWRLTNLVLHLASGALVFTIVRRFSIECGFGKAAIGPSLAAAVFLLFPMSSEAVAWVSGRYDLLAVFFMLATVALVQRASGWRDRWSVASLLTAACALASKESAALLPIFVAALAVARCATRSTAETPVTRVFVLGVRDALPWLLLCCAYFGLRVAIFGSPFQVYAGSSPLRALASGAWLPAWRSASAWVDATLPLPFARAVFLSSMLVVLVVGAMASWRRREAWANWLALAVSALLSILLLLPHVAELAADGEQGRLLYTTSAFAALMVGLGVMATMPADGAASPTRSRRTAALGASLTLIVAEVLLLRVTVAASSEAGAQARALVAALPSTASAISGTGYGLVLVPDRMGSVPFARNAQGGLVEPPAQAVSLSSHLIVQTPADLPAWPANAQRGLVDALRRYPLSQVWAAVAAGRASGTALPTDYFCWSETTSAIVKLSVPSNATQGDWVDAWRRALAASPCKEVAAELDAR